MRREDWDVRLSKEVQASMDRPFAWGKNDCVTFAIRCEVALLGASTFPAPPDYDCEEGARAVLSDLGWTDISEVMDSRFSRVAVSYAQRGDIGLADVGRADGALCVCLGTRWAAPGPKGLRFLKMAADAPAWRIV